MNSETNSSLKGQVKEFWERQSCDTDQTRSEKFSREYFEEIEKWRYTHQPFIHSFAQFSRYHGKKVLEVGFGAGTDFIQWLRAGAVASGIDLTQEALDNLSHRIQTYELPAPACIRTADGENLPFPSDQFDLGYSFGVLHHSPDTVKAIGELVRVIRPGGEIKIMLYNRHSLAVFIVWAKQALLRGRPWKSLHWALWNHMESIGTKGYTRREIRQIFSALPVEDLRIQTEATQIDQIVGSKLIRPLNFFLRLAMNLSGRRLGFFHCISATKVER